MWQWFRKVSKRKSRHQPCLACFVSGELTAESRIIEIIKNKDWVGLTLEEDIAKLLKMIGEQQ